MQNKNINIVGGCMITQTGILPAKLFHQVLRKNIEEKKHAKINIKLEAYNEFLDLNEKMKRWVELPENNDLFIVQYRPEFLLRRLKLFIHKSEYDTKLILNPALTSSNTDKIYQKMYFKKNANKISNYFSQEEIKTLNSIKRLVLLLNILFGSIFLRNKTKNSFKHFLQDIDQIAVNFNLNVLFIGVIPTPMVFFNHQIIGSLNHDLRNLPFKKLKYVEVYSELIKDKTSNYVANNYHISEKGHQIISTALFNTIEQFN